MTKNLHLAQAVKDALGFAGLADAYKPTHSFQYPPDTKFVDVYFEARKDPFGHGKVVTFGDQIFNLQYLAEPFTMDQLRRSDEFWKEVGVPFPEEDCRYIVEELGGKLPLEIRQLPDGTLADTHTALYTMRNTIEGRCAWLPAFIETLKQQNTWYPTSVATLSWTAKQIQYDFHKESSCLDESEILYKLQDFGFRATTCLEQSIIGGMAHALNYRGSDTSVSNMGIELVYGKTESGLLTHSICAMEHMTSTAWGRENEVEAIRNFVERVCYNNGRGGAGSIIIDTYDALTFVKRVLVDQLSDLIEKVRRAGGVIILRPDSGDPVEVPVTIMQQLMEHYGYYTNMKGYHVLPNHFRVIQGDGMTLLSIAQLYDKMRSPSIRYSIDNLCVGMGGGLLQKVDRDMLGMAQKGSFITVGNKSYGISKDPATDPGKRSQEGQFSVIRDPVTKRLINVPRGETGSQPDLLRTSFLNGEILVKEDWVTVLNRLEQATSLWRSEIYKEPHKKAV